MAQNNKNLIIATPGNLEAYGAQSANADNAAAQQRAQQTNPAVSSGGSAMTGGSVPVSNGYSGSVMAKKQPSTYNGMAGVRDTLNNIGIQNVGWNDATKSVTIDGRDYLTPAAISDEGKSYSNNPDIYAAANNYFRDTGNPVEGATSYVAGKGIDNAVTWSDGQLMVGGQVVPVAYVDQNGKAFAHKSDLDAAIASYKKNAGITGNQEVYRNWQNAYGSKIKNALNDFTSRKEWSYDPENDPAYQAYKEQYIREGNRAYQDAYAQMAANTGGYGSSAAMNAAGQQMNYYMQQLGDRIPELMNNDYTRYLGEYELRQKALDNIRNVANDDYNKAYQANRDAISDTNEANYRNWLRDTDVRDFNYEREKDERVWDYDKQLYADRVLQSHYDTDRYERNADLDLQSKELNNHAAELANWQNELTNILSKYQYSGNIDMPISTEDAQKLGISAKADGTYPTIREIQTQYAQLLAIPTWEEWDKAGRQITAETFAINNPLGVE